MEMYLRTLGGLKYGKISLGSFGLIDMIILKNFKGESSRDHL